MPESPAIDYYEVLQLSPRADQDTIQRVFRHLAKRLHPDNAESGDAARFEQVMRAYRVDEVLLSSPAINGNVEVRIREICASLERPVRRLRMEIS